MAGGKRGGKKRAAAVEEDAEDNDGDGDDEGGEEGEDEEEAAGKARSSSKSRARGNKAQQSSGKKAAAKPSAGKRSKGGGAAEAAEEDVDVEEIDWEARHALAPHQLSVSLSADPQLRETVLGAVQGLGGCSLPVCQEPLSLGPQVSHLIVHPAAAAAAAGDVGPGGLKRTGKLLFAMARGVPVVTADWVLHSVSEGKWMDASDFEAVPAHPNAGRQLMGKLFFVKSTDTIDKALLEALILAAGGAVVSRRTATHMVAASGGLAPPVGGDEEGDWRAPTRVDERWVFEEVMGTREEEDDDEEDDGEDEDSEEF